MKILLVVTHSKMAQEALPWLAEVSRRRNDQLLVTNCVLNPISVPGIIDAWLLIEDPKKVRTSLTQIVDDLSADHVSLLDEIGGAVPEQILSEVVTTNQIDVMYFPLDAEQSIDTPDMQFAQQVLRNVPCDAVVLDFGQSDISSVKRIVVPVDLSDSRHVLQYLIEHGTSIETVVPLHVAPDFGGDSRKIAESEMDKVMEEVSPSDDSIKMSPRVVLADGFHEGILRAVHPGDTIVMGGSSVKLVHDLRREMVHLRPQISKSIVIGVFRPSMLAAKTRFGRIGKRLQTAIPELSIADRISLFDRIQGGARLTSDFIAMMALSVLIASLGLLADNASVVIGAMLVAPFMTPLVGVGLAQAQGNLALMNRSGIATATGLVVGFVLSFLLGIFVPIDELPLEILSRGDPDIVDLAIAFISGMAAAYAVSREAVAESIVGVAIAAALVPPLSCVGITCGNGNFFEAQGALILLVTNLAAISLGAALVFRILGVPGTRTRNRSHLMVRRVSIVLISFVFVLTIPLTRSMARSLAVGQIRPTNFRVSRILKEAVHEKVNQIDGLEIIFMGRSGSGQSKLIRILLSADEPVSPSVVKSIEEEIRETLGEDTPIQINVFQNAVAMEQSELE